MTDDLVERVARAACASVNSADTWGETGTDVHEMVWFPIARAAIAVCMEEAADAVGEVGDHAEVGAYINAIRALAPK